MGRSMEFGSRRNAEASKIAEGANEYADKPFNRDSALDAVKEMKRLIDSLPKDEDSISREVAKKEARDNVIASFHKAESSIKTRDIDQPEDLEGREFKFTSNQKPSEEAVVILSEEKMAPVKEIVEELPVFEEVTEEPTEEVPISEGVAEEKTDRLEGDIETDKQPDRIDENIYRTLFGVSTNIRNMLGDQQFSKWQNIVNQDINNGKYTNAKYEDGLVYYIGKVNEYSTDERGNEWNIMKYRSQDERLKYNEQVKSMDPKVWKQVNKTIYALGATLGDNSREYHDALNKINQDIYDGRYKNAEYVAVRNEGEESEEGVVIFNEVVNKEYAQEEPANKPETAKPENEITTNTQTENLGSAETSTEDSKLIEAPTEKPFQGEMTEIIKFEIRTSVDTLKKIYARLDRASTEQRDRFMYLYRSLSATSKMKPLNKDEEQKKLDLTFAYRDLIDKLYSELGGE